MTGKDLVVVGNSLVAVDGVGIPDVLIAVDGFPLAAVDALGIPDDPVRIDRLSLGTVDALGVPNVPVNVAGAFGVAFGGALVYANG